MVLKFSFFEVLIVVRIYFYYIQILKHFFVSFIFKFCIKKQQRLSYVGRNINCCTVKAFLKKFDSNIFFSVRQFFPFLNSRRIGKVGYDRTVVPLKYSL